MKQMDTRTLVSKQTSSEINFEDFDYIRFKWLWQAHALHPAETKRLQRQVGEELNRNGGFASMQLHLSLLHCAMCSGAFIDRDAVPIVVFGGKRQVDFAWDGIGDWKA
eukprot:Skav220661  [mRNA]  locus=scaffold3177:10343:10666:- [translate_table: standard]